MKKASNVIAWIFLVLLFAAGLGVVVSIYKDNAQEGFVVQVEGERLTSSHVEKVFLRGHTYRFDVGYWVGDSEQAKTGDYSVKIIANPEAKIEFLVGQETHLWQDEEITEAFKVKKDEAGFTFGIPMNITFQTVVESLYPEGDVSTPSEVALKKLYPYTILISSNDEKTVYAVDFNFPFEAYGISLKVFPESCAQHIDFRCPDEARGGDRVEFTFSHSVDLDHLMPYSQVKLIYGDDPEHVEELFCDLQLLYSFDMPFCDVTVELHLFRTQDFE